MFARNVADGVHLIQHANVNCWLIEGGGGLTLVDAGLPRTWKHLYAWIPALGYRWSDLQAVVLTHAHFDHMGMVRRLSDELGLPVYAHPAEAELVRCPYRYAHERAIASYPIRHPKAIPILASMIGAGAGGVRGLKHFVPLPSEGEIAVPGHPRIIATPGHTFGHISLHLPDRDAVLTGDALVTLDPYTAQTGPRIVAGAATADSELALRSLDAIARTQATILLPGHGDPWQHGAAAAVRLARDNGPT